MLKLTKVKNNTQLESVKSLYLRAFPKNERKPFEIILEKQDKGYVEILVIEDNNANFMGFAITVTFSKLVLLDYFAIEENMRGKGIGSKIFTTLKKQYQDKKFFLEIESTKITSSNKKERIFRKKFYEQCGMIIMPFGVNLFGVEMEILSAGLTINYNEYYSLYLNVFGQKAANNIYCLN